MARGTHYETLGLRPTANEGEVKAAYRRLALRHHPDRSPDPASTRLFMEATAAYEVLSDPQERRRYDEGLQNEARRAAEKEAETRRQKDSDARVRAARAASTPGPRAAPPGTPIPTQLARLSMLFSRGLYAEAERLADEIVGIDPRQPLPYAIRGDLARQRGKLDEAARHYSLAIQMDPRNPTYLKRYEEVLERAQVRTDLKGAARLDPDDRRGLSLLALGVLAFLCGVFLLFSPESPDLPLGWTVGHVAMLFVGGVLTGACLAMGGLLDRLDAHAAGRLGPTVALGLVAIASFPAAMALYGLLGLLQRGFSLTTTRLALAVAGLVAVLALASTLGPAHVPLATTLLWGGNLAYLGALGGWAVADSLRR